MSTIAVNAITDAAGGNTATINSMTPTADSLQGFRNRIINGGMVIDQRNAGASVTPADGAYTLDRWKAGASAASKFSVQQSSVAPAGFNFSMLCTSLSAYSVGTNDNFEMFQLIEGFNTADLGWGTANAQAVTLSFWVRSSLTGTFGGSIQNSAFDRSYPFSYTISAADIWEQKSVTIAGDTSGTWVGATNGAGIVLCIGLGAGTGRSGTAGTWASATYYNATGAVSVVGTSGATFYITGVQLEAGSVATPFERRPYGQELALCQRYCRTLDSAGGSDKALFSGVAYTNNLIICSYVFPTMRTSPTAAVTNPTAIDVVTSVVTIANNTLGFSEFTPNSCQPSITNSGTPFTAGHGAVIRADGASVVFSAEL